jgi:hypothetical protein
MSETFLLNAKNLLRDNLEGQYLLPGRKWTTRLPESQRRRHNGQNKDSRFLALATGHELRAVESGRYGFVPRVGASPCCSPRPQPLKN